jgi:hypothetical protein
MGISESEELPDPEYCYSRIAVLEIRIGKIAYLLPEGLCCPVKQGIRLTRYDSPEACTLLIRPVANELPGRTAFPGTAVTVNDLQEAH